jgi:hypothetical protein
MTWSERGILMHSTRVVAALALGLAVGVCATPARAAFGEPVATAVASPTAAGHSPVGPARSGRLRLQLSLRDDEYGTHEGLSRVRIHGVVVRRGGGGRGRLFVANMTDAGNGSWTGVATLRHLAPGRYAIRLRSATAAIDVPGGTVRPRRLGISAHVRVRPGRARAVSLAPELPNSFSIRMSGRLIAPDRAPIGGLPVCGLAVSRFSDRQHCDRSGSDGRFVMELRSYDDVGSGWEALKVGDEAEDLPWRTLVVHPRQIGNRVITLLPRGVVTGIVTGGSGQPLAGRSVCSAPLSAHYGGMSWVVRADAWCTTTGADGEYRLRAEDGAQLFLGGDTAAISAEFIRRMDQYLSQDTAQPLFLRDVTTLPESLFDPPQRPHPVPFSEEAAQDTLFRAGGQIDFGLADLAPGREVTVTGSVSRVPVPRTDVGTIGAGEPVCAFSRAGYVCTEADAAGRFRLAVPTWVEPSSPDQPVIVKIVATSTWTSWQPVAVRSAVAPGSAWEQPLQLTAWETSPR